MSVLPRVHLQIDMCFVYTTFLLQLLCVCVCVVCYSMVVVTGTVDIPGNFIHFYLIVKSKINHLIICNSVTAKQRTAKKKQERREQREIGFHSNETPNSEHIVICNLYNTRF